jgi:hypothetical protein
MHVVFRILDGTRYGGAVLISLLWAVVIIFFILWILGFVAFHLGTFVWIFLIIAVIALLFNLFSGSRTGRWY